MIPGFLLKSRMSYPVLNWISMKDENHGDSRETECDTEIQRNLNGIRVVVLNPLCDISRDKHTHITSCLPSPGSELQNSLREDPQTPWTPGKIPDLSEWPQPPSTGSHETCCEKLTMLHLWGVLSLSPDHPEGKENTSTQRKFGKFRKTKEKRKHSPPVFVSLPPSKQCKCSGVFLRSGFGIYEWWKTAGITPEIQCGTLIFRNSSKSLIETPTMP